MPPTTLNSEEPVYRRGLGRALGLVAEWMRSLSVVRTVRGWSATVAVTRRQHVRIAVPSLAMADTSNQHALLHREEFL